MTGPNSLRPYPAVLRHGRDDRSLAGDPSCPSLAISSSPQIEGSLTENVNKIGVRLWIDCSPDCCCAPGTSIVSPCKSRKWPGGQSSARPRMHRVSADALRPTWCHRGGRLYCPRKCNLNFAA